MTSSDDLFLLIKSLSKQEKRYFKLFAERHVKGGDKNQYVEIFDAISRQDKYDEDKLKKELEPKIPVKFFAPKKKYLFDLLLSSLQLYYANDSARNKLIKHLLSIEILYKKGLIKTCSRLLEKTKQMTYQTEALIFLPYLLSMEWNLKLGMRKAEVNESMYEENKSALEKIDNIISYKYLSGQLFSVLSGDTYLRNRDTIKQLKKIMDHPLMQNENMATSNEARSHYLNICGAYYSAIGNDEKGYEYSKKMLLLKENDRYINYANYVGALANLLSECLSTRRLEEHKFFLEKMNALTKELDKKKSQRLMGRIFEIHQMHLQNHYVYAGDYQKIISLIPTTESGISNYKNSITPYIILILYSQIAHAYFGSGNYRKSLEWINKVLLMQKNQSDNLFSTIKLLSLIIHFELGRQELLEYAVKSTYRFFYKRNRLFKFETIVFRYLKNKIPKLKTQKEFIESLKSLKKEIEAIIKDPLEKKALAHFDFIAWIDSKIEKKTFAEVTKEKHENSRPQT